MVYAQTRGVPNAADVRGQMFVELMGAAHRFDPERIGPDKWPKYAWMSLKHALWRGVDDSGVVRKRTKGPRPTTVALGEHAPASHANDPGEVLEQREGVAAITQALGRLPAELRDPLLDSMQGHPSRAIAENEGVSESTARRRIQRARDHIRDELSAYMEGALWVPLERVVADSVLQRSQRLFEEAFDRWPRPEPQRVPAR